MPLLGSDLKPSAQSTGSALQSFTAQNKGSALQSLTARGECRKQRHCPEQGILLAHKGTAVLGHCKEQQ